MLLRGGTAAGLLILLLPSVWFAWQNRDLPDFGSNHDDSLYFVSAKSLAEGHGYRIPSLPENPYQTRYPPLFPMYMALAWKIQPSFPANLPVAALLGWLTIPIVLGLSFQLYRRWGVRTWIPVGLLAINPYIVHFGVSVFSEMFFTCLLLAAIVCLERAAESAKWAAAAGILAGLAYLSRSAGAALFLSGAAVLLWRRQLRSLLIFLACVVPIGLGWAIWAQIHQFRNADEVLLYYTNYLAYRAYAVAFSDYPVMLWKNLDGMLYGMGAMIVPQVVSSQLVKILTEVMAIAMISGVVRLVRRGVAVHYAAFGLASMLTLLVWYFPPNERFVLPLAPLLLAGFLVEMEHLFAMLKLNYRHKLRGNRAMAWAMTAFIAAILAGALALQVFTLTVVSTESAKLERRVSAEHRIAYNWITSNLPPDARVVAYEDPLLYLNTGRTSMTLVIPPKYWYREDQAGKVGFYQKLVAFSRVHGMGYVYFTSEDLSREVAGDEKDAIYRTVTGNPELEPVEKTPIGAIYRVR